MLKEIDPSIAHSSARGVEVVELSATGVYLQPIDDRKTSVIADDEDHLVTSKDAAEHIGIAHEV